MGNRRSRQWLQEQERQATWDRLRSEPWLPDQPGRAFGSGMPRVQVIRSPSFDRASLWEVCELGADWVLYRARVVTGWYPGPLTVQGYEPVTFPSEELKGYFSQITSLSLPLAPYLDRLAGLDGTRTQLTVFGYLSSSVRFQWWSDPPAGWTPLVRLADEMLEGFAAGSAGG